jgi:23S rRNA pseudouridine1911/1915/1917 synthase
MAAPIIYEDNQILVCYKREGVLSQEDISKDPDLLNELKEYIKVKYNKPGAVYLGLVHRLDRNTSGVMVFARTSKAAARLSSQIKEHDGFNKKYLAVVEGKMTKGETKTLVNKLLKNEKENKSYVSNSKDAKEAILEYKVLDSKNIEGKDYSLLDIKLLTGRHHQIRCQLSYIGHPIAGDMKYGAKRNGGNTYNLSSYSLTLSHPVSKEIMTFNYFIPNHLFKRFCDSKDFLKIFHLI